MKQAVVILHGMGEQVPMQTLETFVKTVWTTDKNLVSRGKPDPDTGGTRTGNASWAKPDDRNSSYELRRITTEADKNGNYTDFYEYYWAHLMHGTTWEHVKTWILDLLWRNPAKRVPRRLLHVWVLLWVIALAVIAVVIQGVLPSDDKALPAWWVLASWAGGLAVTAFVSNVLIKRFGDVARYVKALPPNVARRQEIRAKGIDLLDRLIQSGEYDRIVVVAHSLGTIVAYDILTQLFARYHERFDETTPARMKQPERHALEDMIRAAAGLARDKEQAVSETPAAAEAFDIDAYQAQQSKVFAEARKQGFPWIITDFVTLGAPLTHAEFLMADSRRDLRARQASRVLPTCPPTLEYDGTTKLRHFSFGGGARPVYRRLPHHAALFAYTRWTNLYSDHRAIVTGDIISGPVADEFGLDVDGKTLKGIRDIAVLPALDENGDPARGHKRCCFTHGNYWNADKGTEEIGTAAPHHIVELRKALGLLTDRS